ncbi:MAG: hypothetical protein AAF353_07785 [Pseudomonadota bacterium]
MIATIPSLYQFSTLSRMKITLSVIGLLASLFVGTCLAAAKPIPNPPSLKATSFYLVDFDSGRVLAEKDADKRIEPAREVHQGE